MKFKTTEVQRRWNDARVHPKLQALAIEVEGFMLELYDIEPTMTESSRTREETIALYNDPKAPVSTHEIVPLRAFDVRASVMALPQIKELVETINARWIYDPARPNKVCAMFHEVNGRGEHLHFQVADETKLIGLPEMA